MSPSPATQRPDPGSPRPGTSALHQCVLRGDPLSDVVAAAERLCERQIWLVPDEALATELPPLPARGPAPSTGDRVAIVASHRRLGTLVLGPTGRPPTTADRELAGELAVVFALFILMREATSASADGKTGLDTWAVDEFHAWALERRIDPERPFAVLSVQVAPDGHGGRAVDDVRHALELALLNRRIDAFVSWEGTEAELVIPTDDQRPDRIARSIAGHLADQLRLVAPDVRFHIGVASRVGPASTIEYRAWQACIAAEIGLRVGTSLTTNLTELKATGALRMAVLGSDSATTFAELHTRYLEPLLSHEQRTGLPLVRTLMALFDENSNVAATARSLGLTRQSLYYRLGRVEELCDVNLEDPFDRFALELAFRSWAGSHGDLLRPPRST